MAIKNKNQARKVTLNVITVVAVAGSFSSPLLLATPATAETENARSQVDFLRKIAGSNMVFDGQRSFLRGLLIEANQSDASQLVMENPHTNGHGNVHGNSHTNKA